MPTDDIIKSDGVVISVESPLVDPEVVSVLRVSLPVALVVWSISTNSVLSPSSSVVLSEVTDVLIGVEIGVVISLAVKSVDLDGSDDIREEDTDEVASEEERSLVVSEDVVVNSGCIPNDLMPFVEWSDAEVIGSDVDEVISERDLIPAVDLVGHFLENSFVRHVNAGSKEIPTVDIMKSEGDVDGVSSDIPEEPVDFVSETKDVAEVEMGVVSEEISDLEVVISEDFADVDVASELNFEVSELDNVEVRPLGEVVASSSINSVISPSSSVVLLPPVLKLVSKNFLSLELPPVVSEVIPEVAVSEGVLEADI